MDDHYSVDEDTTLIADDTLGLGNPNDDSVLVNDSDPQSDPLSISSDLGPMAAGSLGGTVDMSIDGTFSYVPPRRRLR